MPHREFEVRGFGVVGEDRVLKTERPAGHVDAAASSNSVEVRVCLVVDNRAAVHADRQTDDLEGAAIVVRAVPANCAVEHHGATGGWTALGDCTARSGVGDVAGYCGAVNDHIAGTDRNSA